MIDKKLHPNSLALHSGFRSDPATNSVAPPIYQTTSYQFDNTEHASNLFALSELGNIYTRIMNPTCDILEKRMAEIEGGAAALAVSSGQAATTFSILNLCESGDNFVASTDLYGGTWNLFANTFKQLGIEVRFADPSEPDNFKKLTDEKTRCYYAETLPNPKLEVFPIEEVSKIGNNFGVPLIMDNTATPLICRPIEHGASIVVYSTTKYIGGHGNSIGGIIIDSGNFEWEKHAARFPLLSTPDPSYHGAVWIEAVKPLGPIAYILRARVTLLRDIGACMSPFNAFNFIQGIETLPLRIERHCENAEKIAKFLNNKKGVKKVIYPSLMSGYAIDRAQKYLREGYNGALVGFELEKGMEAGQKFIDSLKMIYHVANIGDARTLAIHPASTTHSQLSDEEKIASGVTPGYVRLSVGLEYYEDIISDIDQALKEA